MADYDDRQDNPGIKVPPPLIYLLALFLGAALDTRAHEWIDAEITEVISRGTRLRRGAP